MDANLITFCLVALGVGALIGWLIGGRSAPALQAERDLHLANFKQAIVDLETAVRERDTANLAVAGLNAERQSREAAFEAQLTALREAKEALSAQFSEVGGKILGEAQAAFLDRAEARFKQSEETSGQGLRALLAPVHDRLLRYEEGVA